MATDLLLYLEIDLIGLAILLVIYGYGGLGNGLRAQQWAFHGLICSCAVFLLSDIASWLLEGSTAPLTRGLLVGSAFLYYVVSLLLCAQWLLYCHCHLTRQMPDRRALLRFLLPWMAAVLLFLINLGTGWIYYYDAEGMYHRGSAYWLHPMIVVLFVVEAVVMILRGAPKENFVRRHDAYALLLFALPPVTAFFVQAFFYGISIIPVSTALALLIVFVQRLSALVTVDPLTELNNRRSFEQYIEKRVGHIPEGQRIFLMMLDANSFKTINDTYGHHVGNEALIKISCVLKRSCCRSDFLARLGGDEFIIAGTRADPAEIGALRFAIDRQLEAENACPETPYTLSLSAGWAVYDADRFDNADAFLHAADQQMYQNKMMMKRAAAS